MASTARRRKRTTRSTCITAPLRVTGHIFGFEMRVAWLLCEYEMGWYCLKRFSKVIPIPEANLFQNRLPHKTSRSLHVPTGSFLPSVLSGSEHSSLCYHCEWTFEWDVKHERNDKTTWCTLWTPVVCLYVCLSFVYTKRHRSSAFGRLPLSEFPIDVLTKVPLLCLDKRLRCFVPDAMNNIWYNGVLSQFRELFDSPVEGLTWTASFSCETKQSWCCIRILSEGFPLLQWNSRK